MGSQRRLLTARDVMVRALVTLRPEWSIFKAIRILLDKRISGAPVVDGENRLIGVLSELDCLRVLTSDEFYAGQQEESGTVEHFMTASGRTIDPDLGLYAIAHYFLTTPIRRLPVIEGERLIGQVSRRDVLLGIERMIRAQEQPVRSDLREISRRWSALSETSR